MTRAFPLCGDTPMFTGRSLCHYNYMKAAKMLGTGRLVKRVVKTCSACGNEFFFRSHAGDPACRENMFRTCTQIEFFSKI
jgi:hypothetical protein